MQRIMQKTTDISKIVAWGSGFLLLATCVLITVEILLRKILNFSILGVDEITGYVLAIVSAWIFGFSAIKGAHIRVDSIIALLPSKIIKSLDLLASFSLFLLALILTYHAMNVLSMSFTYNSKAISPLQTPLWIPQLAWFLGNIFFTVCTLVILLGKIWSMVTGKIIEFVEHT
ncbi:MAG: TRAP transporter small permease [Deltaproteobacteria bacterium]|jgi:TRAP-type C4-dicarboxylate transport system permease small subunit|nr:TRAP transporter small permease [Deltaproteobacteria bacterium]MBT4267437.1 TRAP transporter small permease [Deltaproteobacteria bacterium]MBT4640865.1 TRAP transporter small permease [Deltaproteobacteria bacterium]MBT6502386.1 TRAP transporter small permease [Deltaproteobacteria bacterium]MBT6612214.1 TRAP transporter small permease [Deltaproteobacteria bacterium]